MTKIVIKTDIFEQTLVSNKQQEVKMKVSTKV